MLVLTRKAQEQIQIGHNIKVTVVRVKGHSVRLGIEAPENVRIVRGELAAAMAEFRDDETMADGGEFDSGELDEAPRRASDALRSSDEEDETPTRGPRASVPPSPLPFGRAPGDSRCQLRRPPRLGPAAFRPLRCR
jgi:carbon storage regulator CsrA